MSAENISGENMEAAVPPTEVSEAHTEQKEVEQMVPLSALQSERAQRQKSEQEAQFYRENLDLWKANVQNQMQPQPKQGLDAMSENDVLTVGEARKFIDDYNRQTQLSIEELRITQKYPDYQEVITRFLPELLKTNPRLKDSLIKTNDYELAYYLAKNSDIYRDENKKKSIHADAERIVQNSKNAGSLSSVGSTSPISNAKRYRDMSDNDFMKEVNKNLGYI